MEKQHLRDMIRVTFWRTSLITGESEIQGRVGYNNLGKKRYGAEPNK